MEWREPGGEVAAFNWSEVSGLNLWGKMSKLNYGVKETDSDGLKWVGSIYGVACTSIYV